MADHPLQNVPTGKISLRPGITADQIEMEAERRSSMTVEQQIAADNANKPSSTSTPENKAKKVQVKKQDDYDMDDEYDFDDDEDADENDNVMIGVGAKASQSTMDLKKSSTARQISRFSGSGPAMSSTKKSSEVNKTIVKIFSPVFAFCFARETLRWNREQNNVDKGIEIMEQQRQEYLNSKKNGDDDDDDDDDDVSFPRATGAYIIAVYYFIFSNF